MSDLRISEPGLQFLSSLSHVLEADPEVIRRELDGFLHSDTRQEFAEREWTRQFIRSVVIKQMTKSFSLEELAQAIRDYRRNTYLRQLVSKLFSTIRKDLRKLVRR